eukprot:GHVS01097924.1.p1 GENE.GHVS01097924.1~~GHVS01097924.1.p1  ORF type:complete len:492 (+),score=93.89 GHVS01097924.1:77-1552(+)
MKDTFVCIDGLLADNRQFHELTYKDVSIQLNVSINKARRLLAEYARDCSSRCVTVQYQISYDHGDGNIVVSLVKGRDKLLELLHFYAGGEDITPEFSSRCQARVHSVCSYRTAPSSVTAAQAWRQEMKDVREKLIAAAKNDELWIRQFPGGRRPTAVIRKSGNSSATTGGGGGRGPGGSDGGGGKPSDSKRPKDSGQSSSSPGAGPSTGSSRQPADSKVAGKSVGGTKNLGGNSCMRSANPKDSDKTKETPNRRAKVKSSPPADANSNKRRKKDDTASDASKSCSPAGPSLYFRPQPDSAGKQPPDGAGGTAGTGGSPLDAFLYEGEEEGATESQLDCAAAGAVTDSGEGGKSLGQFATRHEEETKHTVSRQEQQEEELFLSDNDDDTTGSGEQAETAAGKPSALRRTTMKKKVKQERTYVEGNAIVFEDVETMVETPVDASPPPTKSPYSVSAAAPRATKVTNQQSGTSKNATAANQRQITSYFRPKAAS